MIGLDVQQKKHRPSAFWKRISCEDTELANASSAIHDPLIDQINADDAVPQPELVNQLSEEKHCKPGSGNTALFVGALGKQSTEGCSRKSLQKSVHTQPRPKSIVNDAWLRGHGPRRFHLAKAAQLPITHQLFTECGIRKKVKQKCDNLAVFVERDKHRNGTIRNQALLHILRNDSYLGVDDEDKNTQMAVPRKRPIINTAERARKETSQLTIASKCKDKSVRLEQSTKKLPNPCEPTSEKLAAKLQHVALEEVATGLQGSTSEHKGAHLKFRPRPPKPREQRASFIFSGGWHGISSAGNDQEDNNSGYVYDTYVKTSPLKEGENSEVDSGLDPVLYKDGNRVGLLIIEDEEEALWETFADLEASDPAYNSEEEDENG